MALSILLVGLVIFFGVHSIGLFTPHWKDAFIQKYGRPTWMISYSVASLVGLALIVWGYAGCRVDPVFIWLPPAWTRHLTMLLAWVGFILITASFVPRNHIKAALGHPMFAGVKIWALAHLIANGRLSEILTFTAFLLWGVLGFSLSRRRDRATGVLYPEGSMLGTVSVIFIGTLLTAGIVFYLHAVLIGVSLL